MLGILTLHKNFTVVQQLSNADAGDGDVDDDLSDSADLLLSSEAHGNLCDSVLEWFQKEMGDFLHHAHIILLTINSFFAIENIEQTHPLAYWSLTSTVCFIRRRGG